MPPLQSIAQYMRLLGMGGRTAPTIEELIRTERALEGMRVGSEAERAWQLQQMRRVRQLMNEYDKLQPEALPNLSLDELRRSTKTGGPKQSLHKELMDREIGDNPPGPMQPVGQETVGFKSGGGGGGDLDFGGDVPLERSQLARKKDELINELQEMEQYANEVGPEDVEQIQRRYSEIHRELASIDERIRSTRPRPNDPYSPLDEHVQEATPGWTEYDETDYGTGYKSSEDKVKWPGDWFPEEGFSSSGGRGKRPQPKLSPIQQEAQLFFSRLTPRQQAEIKEYMNIERVMRNYDQHWEGPLPAIVQQSKDRMDELAQMPHIAEHVNLTRRWEMEKFLGSRAQNKPGEGFASGGGDKPYDPSDPNMRRPTGKSPGDTEGGGSYDPDTGRWNKLGSNENFEKLSRYSQGSLDAIDRRMGQIGDEILNLEKQRETIDPAKYKQLRQSLEAEYRNLDRQRVRISKQKNSGQMETVTTAPGRPTDARAIVGEAYKRGWDKHRIRVNIEKQLRDVLTEARMASRRGDDEAMQRLMVRSKKLEEGLRYASELPEGVPKQPIGHTIMETIEDVAGPRKPWSNIPGNPLSKNILRASQFFPVGSDYGKRAQEAAMEMNQQSQVPPVDPETERMIKEAIGLGGAAIEATQYAPEALPYTMAYKGLVGEAPFPPTKPPIEENGRFVFQPRQSRLPARQRAQQLLETHFGR